MISAAANVKLMSCCSYLAGINSSLVPPSAEHGGPNPAQVVLIAGFRGQDGHIHLLETVNSGPICGTKRSELCCSESRFQFGLTLAGGAPAGDGARAEGGQRGRPDVDGSDQVIEKQRLLELQQAQVILFGATVVAVMVDDARDSDHL